MKGSQVNYSTKKTIQICRFVQPLTADGARMVKQAADGSLPVVGISAQSPEHEELPLYKTMFERGVVGGGGTVDASAAQTYEPYAALGTDADPVPVRMYGPGEIAPMRAGAAFAAGVHLMPNANGEAIAVTDGNYYGAIALEAATAAGEKVDVQVVPSAYFENT